MSASRRERQRQATHQEIIAIARQQITEHGAAALSLRAIARQMGVTPPALYRYFENRDALVTALIVIAYQALQSALESARQDHEAQSYTAQLLATGKAYRQWGLDYPQDYTLIFGTPIPGYRAPQESLVPLARSSLGVLVGIIQAGQAAGEFQLPDESPQLTPDLAAAEQQPGMAAQLHVAIALWSHVHGLTSLEIFNHFETLLQNPDDLFELELTAKLNSLLGKE